MTLQALIARPLMALAAALTPTSRTEWSLAMRQEFEALPDGQGALVWATGCLANALGWRMRAEAPFGFVTVVAILSGSWLISPLVFNLIYALFAPDWVGPMASASIALQAAVCLALALAWPRRAVLAGVLVPLVWQDAAMPQFTLLLLEPTLEWTRQGAHPDILVVASAFSFFWDTMWPCLLAAALGWGLSRLLRARRAATA
ncbi:MAG: hypothetical protein EBR82_18495 [Caulobacteraceae bacterium]|nr:hypothetical protein [Caulobacteraceae bacterium]